MMSRRGDDWITNVNRGAVPERFCGCRQVELCDAGGCRSRCSRRGFRRRRYRAVGDGRLFVLEVNSMPAWSGLQSVVAVNIADAIVAGFAGSPGGRAARRSRFALVGCLSGSIRDMGASSGGHSERLSRSLPAGNRGAEARQCPSFLPMATACRPISSLIVREVSSAPFTDPNLTVGRRILEAVRATRQAVGTNTNLGIILLCAPLVRAAEMNATELRGNLDAVLGSMTMDDAAAVFEAIVLASPGGLGSADAHDVRNAPTVPLLEAMREASGRDRIARQYVTGFDDIFEVGLPALDSGIRSRGESGHVADRLYLHGVSRPPFRTAMWRASTARKSQRRCRMKPRQCAPRWTRQPAKQDRIALAHGIRPER